MLSQESTPQEGKENTNLQASQDEFSNQNELQARETYKKENFSFSDCCLVSSDNERFYFLTGLLFLKSNVFKQAIINFKQDKELKDSETIENVDIIQISREDDQLQIQVKESGDTLFFLLEILYRAPTNQSILQKESAYKVTQLAAKYELEEVLLDCYKYVSEHLSRWELLQTVTDGNADMIDWFLLSKNLKWQRVYDQCFRRIVKNLSRLQQRDNFERISKEEKLSLFQQAFRLEHEKTEDQKKPVKPLKFPEEMNNIPAGPLSGSHQGSTHSHQILNLASTKSQTNSARTPRTAVKTPRQNMGRTPRQNSARQNYHGPEQSNGYDQAGGQPVPGAGVGVGASSFVNGEEGGSHFARKGSLNGGSYDYESMPSPNIERSTSLEGGCSISVKSLPLEITEEFLLETFAHFGQIIGHKLNYTTTGAHAFIDYADASSGFKACRQNIFIENQQLQVRIKRMGAKKLVQASPQ